MDYSHRSMGASIGCTLVRTAWLIVCIVSCNGL